MEELPGRDRPNTESRGESRSDSASEPARGSERRRTSSLWARASTTFTVLTLLNGLVLGIVASALGGDAVRGYAHDGHYYLGEHGEFTEVGRRVFWWSKIHTWAVIVSWPTMFLLALGRWLGRGVRAS